MADASPIAPAASLPEGLEPYSRTPTFTEQTLPEGLRKDHSTKPGSWGLIHVEQGMLRYCVTDSRRLPAQFELTPEGRPGVVEPTILHHVEPVGPVQFYVQFLRAPSKAVPLCEHEELAERENRERAQK